jgi:hypothetical protein
MHHIHHMLHIEMKQVSHHLHDRNHHDEKRVEMRGVGGDRSGTCTTATTMMRSEWK